MSNYTKSTNFTSKDSLPTGDSLKIVRGAEFDTEFNAIATAVATKADTASPTLTSPTLVTPALGTPASGVMTNVTGLPLTTGVTGTLPVANGGTGATTLTANNVLLGNGTSALQVVAPGSSGNVLTSNGTTWTSATPSSVVSSAVAGNGIAVSAATGAVTFSVAVPTYGSIGSYIMAQVNVGGSPTYTVTAGADYAAGTGRGQVTSTTLMVSGQYSQSGNTNNLSGTWRWFGGTYTNQNIGCCSFPPMQAIAVRIA